jgi:hypothetical protein
VVKRTKKTSTLEVSAATVVALLQHYGYSDAPCGKNESAPDGRCFKHKDGKHRAFFSIDKELFRVMKGNRVLYDNGYDGLEAALTKIHQAELPLKGSSEAEMAESPLDNEETPIQAEMPEFRRMRVYDRKGKEVSTLCCCARHAEGLRETLEDGQTCAALPGEKIEECQLCAYEKRGDSVQLEGRYKVGQLVQYFNDGQRAGYLADVPADGMATIQPIGVAGAELPKRIRVKASEITAIIEDKFAPEEIMAKITKKNGSAKAAGKTAAPKKAAHANGNGAGRGRTPLDLSQVTVTLKKMPEEGALRGYGLALLETLKANGKKMTAADLVKKLKTDTKNKNGQLAVYTFHKPKLESAGYIEVK